MFERYTEKARRAVFFARYEVSQYGGKDIETEHLLLGLLREDLAMRALLKDTGELSEIRAEIEKTIQRGERIPTSVEIPLSDDSKRALTLAAGEAERLGLRFVGPEHILLGILRVPDSIAAQIINRRGLAIEQLREMFARSAPPVKVHQEQSAPASLEAFLSGLKSTDAQGLMPHFSADVRLVDVFGNSWKYAEIAASFEELFAPYAKKNAAYLVEEVIANSATHFVALVLWKNALIASMERVWLHRMIVVLSWQSEDWAIVSLQITPVLA
jgi:hypothetical protein